MKKYVSVLRGINVGGHRKILMADLRSLFSGLGFLNIETYIQSGNVLFDSNKNQSCSELANIIQEKIKTVYNYEVPVIVIKAESLTPIINNNPFADGVNINQLFLTFLSEKPKADKVIEMNKLSFSPDKFEVKESLIYGYFHGKFHQTKISNQLFEKKLKVSATTRNWKTVLKISELILSNPPK